LDVLIPWYKLEQQLAKKYSKVKLGRPPYALSSMLRVHVMQIVYNLSDPGFGYSIPKMAAYQSTFPSKD
jgi:transposase, IS5 family